MIYTKNGDNQEFLGVIDTINFGKGVTILDSTPIPSSEHIHHNLTQNSNKMTRPQLNTYRYGI
jgi:hypothetical protein